MKGWKAKNDNVNLSLYIVGLGRILRSKISKVILPLALFLLTCLLFTLLNQNHESKQYEAKFYIQQKVSRPLLQGKKNTGCAIPILDPFDSLMKRYFQQWSTRQDCSQLVSYFRAGVAPAYQKESNPPRSFIQRAADFPKDHLTCCFEAVTFLHIHLYKFREGKGKTCEIIREDVTPIQPSSVEYVHIKCFPIIPPAQLEDPRMGRLLHLRLNSVHSEILTLVHPPKTPSTLSNQLSHGQEKLNVIVFVLVGISRLNFIRLMRRSFAYLVEELQAADLHGYASVGGGALQNSFALLLGKSFDEVRRTCWKRDNSTFDKCPWIWKSFSRKGYTTLFAEDYNSVYNFHLGGFKATPTDYYLFPFSKWLGNRVLKNLFGNQDCIRNVPTVNRILEYAKQASTVLKSVPSFQLYWAGLLNYLPNDPALFDEPLVELLRYWKESGILNNTAVVIASDHGWKTGRIMSQSQARIENRMPFCFLLLPKQFQQLNHDAYQYLLRNKFRLTTHFDVHATLLQILQAGNSLKLKPHVREGKSTSLFLPIQKNRDCKMLGITENWCICDKYRPLSTESSLVKQLAIAAVKEINNLLVNYPICFKYELGNVVHAELKENFAAPEEEPYISELKTLTYRLVIQVMPKGATFQVIMFNDTETGLVSLSPDIFRINTFLHHCISDQQLLRLCSCEKSWDNSDQRRYWFWNW